MGPKLSFELTKPTPAKTEQRPGLTRLDVRVGEYESFRTSLHRSLSSRHRPGLKLLTTRDSRDWTIGFIDAWASVCDVLSFYNNEIANESYLGTASDPQTIRGYARMIGYAPAPGVAAMAYLTFDVDTVEDIHAVTEIDAGFGVKSIPADGELPQTYETLGDVRLKSNWNALRPLQSLPQKLTSPYNGFYVAATQAEIRRGRAVIYGRLNLAVVGADAEPDCIHTISKVVPVVDSRAAVDLNWVYMGEDLRLEIPSDAVIPSEAAYLPTPPPHRTLKTSTLEGFFDALRHYAWPRADVLRGMAHHGLEPSAVNPALSQMNRATQSNTNWPFELTIKCRLFGHNALTRRETVPNSDGSGTQQVVIGPVPTTPTVVNSDLENNLPNPPGGQVYLYLDRNYEDISTGDLILIRARYRTGSRGRVESWSRDQCRRDGQCRRLRS